MVRSLAKTTPTADGPIRPTPLSSKSSVFWGLSQKHCGSSKLIPCPTLLYIRSNSCGEFSIRVFRHYNVPAAGAAVAADVLAASDLRGIDSHGIARLPMYADFLSSGQINPRPNISIVRESPSTASVDGDNGLGLVVGPRANGIAMDKADAVGSGWVSVCHSTHFGIAGYYPLAALRRDMIGWAMTNGTSWMAPLWGTQRRLGTNPLAIAFPGKLEPPIVIDMATTAVAYGKVQLARGTASRFPRDGRPTRMGAPPRTPMRLTTTACFCRSVRTASVEATKAIAWHRWSTFLAAC